MHPGDVVGGRFEIERLAGTGGMGQVFRARDQTSGEGVALKVLRERDSPETARFELEARVLSDLSHPGIVRHLAHGVTPSGELYLAMEWLEGEDLQSHLLRTRMTVEESILLAKRVAEALGAAHAIDIVHRDLKPNNLFLVDRRIDQVKLLDFGIARHGGAGRMTQSGVRIGTPGYMAPEQARSGDVLDARVDVFSLGCVLFECLTGTPAFAGDHVMAILVKTIYADIPRVRDLRPDIPEGLDALVTQMLSKKPGERPRNGAAVAAALAALGESGTRTPLRVSIRPSAALTDGERRVLSVVLIGKEPVVETTAEPPTTAWHDAPIEEDADPNQDQVPDATTLRMQEHPGESRLALSKTERTMQAVVAEHGGQFDLLTDGTRVVTLASVGTAIDQAARAARCALLLQSAVPNQPVTLATGSGEMGGRVPIGEVIDRAARLLRDVEAATAAGGAPHKPSVQVDELTARLLSSRFEVEGRLLRGERDETENARTLLGKSTPFVGRERELRALEELLEECTSEPVPRAVLVTAPAGAGKSRLQQELVLRARARAEPVEVWVARGDPTRAGASFGMVGQIIRRAARLLDGETLDARRQRLEAHVARRVDASIRRRVAEFLGEMAGAAFPDQDSVQLRAARHDPMLMGDQMRRAWVDFIEAECRTQPLLVVLEDLHWGDRPSVDLVDTALRILRDKPLMVLALARPEVHERFPRLWSERGVMELALGELSRKAREKLTHEVLGAEVPTETVERLVERSAGNAFFLEELLRAEAEGRRDVPDTVLAMVQSRLATLEPLERRVLRAGSVFGQVFWRGGVDALLGGATRPLQIDDWLAGLEKREWIAERPEATFQGEREYLFRNATVREAAYAMLTNEDRTLGHCLAGEWLEEVGEADAMVLAEHFDQGNAPERALGWYQRAAAQALEGNDLAAAIARATRATALGASGEALGELHLIRAEAHGWRGDNADAERWAMEAVAALPAGKTRWYEAVREAAKAASKLGHNERLAALAETLGHERPDTVTSAAEAATVAQMVVSLTYVGLLDRTRALHERLAGATERFGDDPEVSAHIFAAQALGALYEGDAGGYLAFSEAAQVRFEQAGDLRAACVERAHMGYACNELGAYDEGTAILRAAITDAERMGLRNTVGLAKHNLGLALARTGAPDEARAVETEAALTFAAQGDRHLECAARCYLAVILRTSGAFDDAEVEARRAVEIADVVPTLRPFALAVLSGAMLSRGHVAEARATAKQAAAILESRGDIEEGELFVRLILAETFEASGNRTSARAAISAARDRLVARAARIADPARRAGFLERVPEHARILEFARAWLDAKE